MENERDPASEKGKKERSTTKDNFNATEDDNAHDTS